MKRTLLAVIVLASVVATVGEARATTLTFGTTGGGGNSFPFGGYATAPGTDYQQVYNGALFGTSPILITTLEFFGSEGIYDDGTYTFSLSTTSSAVNGLDTTTLSNNVGGDSALFASVSLSGSIPSVLSISGGPFWYDPTLGNLLVDIQNSSPSGQTGGYFYAMNGTFGTDSSRAHNYGTGFASFGLVTRFTYTPADAASVPEPASLSLLALGLVGLGARRWRQRKA